MALELIDSAEEAILKEMEKMQNREMTRLHQSNIGDAAFSKQIQRKIFIQNLGWRSPPRE